MLFFITALAYEMEIKPLSIPTIQDKLKIRKLIYYRPPIYRRYKIICTKRRKHTTPNPYKPQILWEDTLIPGTTYGTFKPKLFIEKDTVFAGGGGGLGEPVIAVKIYLADGSKVQRKLIHWGSSAGMGFCRTPSKNHFLLGDSFYDTPLILTKLSPGLDSLWTKTYADSARGKAIAADNLGRIIVAGNALIDGFKMWVVYCLDEDGNIVWGDTVTYGECGTDSIWPNDFVWSVACDKSNNIYVTGTVDDFEGNPYPRIIKWDPEGQVEWYWVSSVEGLANGNLNIWNDKAYWAKAPPRSSFFVMDLKTGTLLHKLFVKLNGENLTDRDLQAVRRVGSPQSRSSSFLYVCGICGDSGYIAKTDTLGNLIWECFIYPDWISNLAYVDFYTFNISPDQKRIVAAGFIEQTTGPDVRYVVCINNPSDTLPPNLTILKPEPNQSYDTLSYLVYLLSDSTGYENQGWQGKPRKLEIKLIKKEADTLIDTTISEPSNFAKDSLPLGLTAPKDTGNYNLIIKATDWFYNTTRKELSFSIKVSAIYETRKEITKLHFKSPARKLIINLENPEKITIWDVSGRVVKQCYTTNLIFKPQKSGIFFFKIENQPQIHKIILIK